MRYFPIFYDLHDRNVVIVGGGEEALRKVRLLLKTSARIKVIAPALHEELAAEPRVEWVARSYESRFLDNAVLVYSADRDLNELVSADAKAGNIPVNVVDAADISTFITPSIVDRDPVIVAIGTEGTAPILGQGLRAKIDELLPQSLGRLAAAANGLRERVAATLPPGNQRRSFWRKFFFGPIRESFLASDTEKYIREIDGALDEETVPASGRVSLVGAGPGDPELLTLKAHRKLQEADVIVYDRLVGPAILELARRDAERIAVGKTPYKPSISQAEINSILIREAKAGKIVVRLKGGDPYVFGRGGEEQAALEAEGITVDIVPGITAALGCAASIGLPVTQRGANRSFTLITGSTDSGVANHDWTALAKSGTTFAIYMGLNAAAAIVARLIAAGIDPQTPVIIVEDGTLPSERTLESTIGQLVGSLNENKVEGPAIIYVGLTKSKASAQIVPFPHREVERDEMLKAVS